MEDGLSIYEEDREYDGEGVGYHLYHRNIQSFVLVDLLAKDDEAFDVEETCKRSDEPLEKHLKWSKH